jgi:Lhr-like helicase
MGQPHPGLVRPVSHSCVNQAIHGRRGQFSSVHHHIVLRNAQVHILHESRGSTLEVVVARMKTRGTQVRFVMVSATVPNILDVATWVGDEDGYGPAVVFQV